LQQSKSGAFSSYGENEFNLYSPTEEHATWKDDCMRW
jgi:hypothetical protein